MKKIVLLIALVVAVAFVIFMNKGDKNKENTSNMLEEAGGIIVDPIEHASLILSWGGLTIYADPVGENLYAGKPAPDIILLTDIHGDHLDTEALQAVATEKTVIIAPQAVLNEISGKIPEDLKAKVSIMVNGELASYLGFSIEAVPMYNLPESSESYHTKGRGNGYVIQKGDTRVYISGDTSGIPKMRKLKDIDMAFVAMNLPYTMSVEEAANAVLEFKPQKVYPYHYRTPEGFSDVAKFKQLVAGGNPDIEVVQLDWYPAHE